MAVRKVVLPTLPFTINTILESINNNLYISLDEAMNDVRKLEKLLDDAHASAITSNDVFMLPLIKEIKLYASLATWRLFMYDIIGVQWSLGEIKKITGYTPTPSIWIPGKLLLLN